MNRASPQPQQPDRALDAPETQQPDPALEAAETAGHPQTVAAGLLSMGTFHVKRGDVEQAIGLFERARDLCQQHDVRLWKPVFASFLGYSLALSARFSEAEILLREALNEAALMRMAVFHSQMIMWLSEARLLTGAVADAAKLADELYVSVLSRPPTSEEASVIAEYLTPRADRREQAVTNLVWSLIASNEFCTNH